MPPERARGLLAALHLDLVRHHEHLAAETYLRECLTIREKPAPKAWNTANAKSLLGGALLLEKKYADAEPLLGAGYEGLRADKQAIPPHGTCNIPDAIQRLVDLYDATGKPDDAAKWRKELEAWNEAVKKPTPALPKSDKP